MLDEHEQTCEGKEKKEKDSLKLKIKGLTVRGRETESKTGKRPLGGEQRGLSVEGRRRVVMGGRVGLGHSGRGTLTPEGSPLPFPYTAAPASPGPVPASVWRAADTRPRHQVTMAYNGLLSPPPPTKTA